jgi:hypothetical protein
VAGLVLAALLLFAPGSASAAGCDENDGIWVCDARVAQPTFASPGYRPDSLFSNRTYAWVEDYAPFYDAPGGEVVDEASAGQLFYTLEESATDAAGQTWFRVDKRWIQAEYVYHYDESTFAGVEVKETPERPFGWILKRVQPAPAPEAEPAENAPWLERYTCIEIYDAAEGSDGWDWYDLGGGRWIRQTYVSLVDVGPRPVEVGEGEFWVEVDLFEQSVAAYEGDRMVYATPVSTGLDAWATNEGLFTTYTHLREWTMSGGEEGDDYYYLQDVPHTKFFDGEIALHGAYWHDNFGYQMSHGCVNMPPITAEWVFYWSEQAPNEDLWVWVHSSAPDQLLEVFGDSLVQTDTPTVAH